VFNLASYGGHGLRPAIDADKTSQNNLSLFHASVLIASLSHRRTHQSAQELGDEN
jgi:hypothetical protein